MLKKKVVLGLISLFLIGAVCGAAFVYAQGANQIFTISQSYYPGAVSYTIWAEGSNYFAKNALGTIITFGTSASTVIQYVFTNADVGSSILLRTGTYILTSPLTISKSLTVLGEGVSSSGAVTNPDMPPTALSGTVLKVNAGFAGDRVLWVSGNVNNVRLGHFGIWFNTAISAYGLICYNDDLDWGITYGIIEDISVLNGAGTSYAFYFQNFQHLNVRNLRSWGGGFIKMENYDVDIDYGNSVFSECYAYVDRATGTLPAIVSLDLVAGNKLNLMSITRLQVNAKYGDSTAVVKVDGCRYISFNELNVETENQFALIVTASEEITFNNPYVWSSNTPPEGQSNVHWEDSCSYIVMFGGMMDVKVLDTGTGAGNLIVAPKQNWLISQTYCDYIGSALGFSGTDDGATYVAGIMTHESP
jgi:hypothetical protein